MNSMSPFGRTLAGRVIAITGASGTIGAALARAYASAGATMALLDNRPGPVQDLAEALQSMGTRAVAAEVDVTDALSVRAVLNEVVHKFGQLDVMVNNAGVTARSPFLDTSIEEFDHMYRVNALGVFVCLQEAARHMSNARSKPPGKLITTLSSAVQRSSPGYAAYSASKSAALSLVRSSAQELAVHGVTSNALAPGPMANQMHGEHARSIGTDAAARIPLGRLGHPRDLTPAALFLASSGSDWMTGQVVHVDGGSSIA